MPIGPTAEQAALHLVRVMAAGIDRAGAAMRLDSVAAPFGRDVWERGDLALGLRHAVAVGWVERAGSDRIRLTARGHTAALPELALP